ncbi:hypothetical protein G7Y89_g2051 [Cudoniella acicularis]|uniref:DUF6594 domain-containing protein n=1 Tax=Cudoniella acicularis TaxID=354080 RepID=A0A8H4RVW6_9HELO|nr:hypothetical protein G7Y89_g2051 [Cudoniella acicularis]
MFQSFVKPPQIQRQDTTKRAEIRRERDKDLDGLASLTYHERLTEFARNSTRHWVKDSNTVIDFRPLYAITIHHLQRQLSQEIYLLNENEMTDSQLENIRKLLKQYTSALRDFEFIHSNRWSTNFVKDIAASRIDNGPGSRLQAALISEFNLALPNPQYTLYSDDDLLGSFDPSLMVHSVTPGKTTRATQRQQSEMVEERKTALRTSWQRFAFAMLGGLALVIPVLVIVVGTANVPLRALIVVSVSIFLFALAVALLSNTLPENLLAATAAYAAVLVVFISNNGS